MPALRRWGDIAEDMQARGWAPDRIAAKQKEYLDAWERTQKPQAPAYAETTQLSPRAAKLAEMQGRDVEALESQAEDPGEGGTLSRLAQAFQSGVYKSPAAGLLGAHRKRFHPEGVGEFVAQAAPAMVLDPAFVPSALPAAQGPSALAMLARGAGSTGGQFGISSAEQEAIDAWRKGESPDWMDVAKAGGVGGVTGYLTGKAGKAAEGVSTKPIIQQINKVAAESATLTAAGEVEQEMVGPPRTTEQRLRSVGESAERNTALMTALGVLGGVKRRTERRRPLDPDLAAQAQEAADTGAEVEIDGVTIPRSPSTAEQTKPPMASEAPAVDVPAEPGTGAGGTPPEPKFVDELRAERQARKAAAIEQSRQPPVTRNVTYTRDPLTGLVSPDVPPEPLPEEPAPVDLGEEDITSLAVRPPEQPTLPSDPFAERYVAPEVVEGELVDEGEPPIYGDIELPLGLPAPEGMPTAPYPLPEPPVAYPAYAENPREMRWGQPPGRSGPFPPRPEPGMEPPAPPEPVAPPSEPPPAPGGPPAPAGPVRTPFELQEGIRKLTNRRSVTGSAKERVRLSAAIGRLKAELPAAIEAQRARLRETVIPRDLEERVRAEADADAVVPAARPPAPAPEVRPAEEPEDVVPPPIPPAPKPETEAERRIRVEARSPSEAFYVPPEADPKDFGEAPDLKAERKRVIRAFDTLTEMNRPMSPFRAPPEEVVRLKDYWGRRSSALTSLEAAESLKKHQADVAKRTARREQEQTELAARAPEPKTPERAALETIESKPWEEIMAEPEPEGEGPGEVTGEKSSERQETDTVEAEREAGTFTDEWSTEHVTDTMREGYTHLIMGKNDPERSERPKGGRADKAPHRTMNKKWIGDIQNEIREHMGDGEPRTFNRIGVELWDQNASTLFTTKANEALWNLVEDGTLEHTLDAPIEFRLRQEGTPSPDWRKESRYQSGTAETLPAEDQARLVAAFEPELREIYRAHDRIMATEHKGDEAGNAAARKEHERLVHEYGDRLSRLAARYGKEVIAKLERAVQEKANAPRARKPPTEGTRPEDYDESQTGPDRGERTVFTPAQHPVSREQLREGGYRPLKKYTDLDKHGYRVVGWVGVRGTKNLKDAAAVFEYVPQKKGQPRYTADAGDSAAIERIEQAIGYTHTPKPPPGKGKGPPKQPAQSGEEEAAGVVTAPAPSGTRTDRDRRHAKRERAVLRRVEKELGLETRLDKAEDFDGPGGFLRKEAYLAYGRALEWSDKAPRPGTKARHRMETALKIAQQEVELMRSPEKPQWLQDQEDFQKEVQADRDREAAPSTAEDDVPFDIPEPDTAVEPGMDDPTGRRRGQKGALGAKGQRPVPYTVKEKAVNDLFTPFQDLSWPDKLRALPERSREIGRAVKERFAEIFEYEHTVKDQPELRNALRLFLDKRGEVEKVTNRDLLAIVKRFRRPGEYEQFRRLVALEDLIERSSHDQDVPGGLSLEQLQRAHDELYAKATKNAKTGVVMHRALMRQEAVEQVRRGVLAKEVLDRNIYYPHQVVELSNTLAKDSPAFGRRLKEPFRAWARKAGGSTRLIDMDYLRVMQNHLMRVRLANAMDDFALTWLNKLDAITKLPPEARKRLVKPGQTVTIGGKAYQTYAYKGDGLQLKNAIGSENPAIDAAIDILKPVGRFYVIPKNVAERFEVFKAPHAGTKLGEDLRTAIGFWKRAWVDTLGLKFNVMNAIGDATALYREDGVAFLNAFARAQEIYGVLQGRGRQDMLRVFREQGVTDASTLFGAELDLSGAGRELKQLQEHGRFRERPTLGDRAQAALGFLEGTMAKREQWFRLAKAITDYDRIQKKDGRVVTKTVDIQGLSREAALGKVAREFAVDYAAVSPAFKGTVRGWLAPFGTWFIQQARDWPRYLRDHPVEAAAKFGGPLGAIWAWNNYQQGDVERRNPEYLQRSLLHVNTGYRTEDGRDIVISWQTGLDVAAQVFQLDRLYQKAGRVARGETPKWQDALQFLRPKSQEIAQDAAQFGLRMSPLVSLVVGLRTGTDPFTKRQIVTSGMSQKEATKQLGYYALQQFIPFVAEYETAMRRAEKAGSTGSKFADFFVNGPLDWKAAYGEIDVDPVMGEFGAQHREVAEAEEEGRQRLEAIEGATVRGDTEQTREAVRAGMETGTISPEDIGRRLTALPQIERILQERRKAATTPEARKDTEDRLRKLRALQMLKNLRSKRKSAREAVGAP